jgi:hypothetical protein
MVARLAKPLDTTIPITDPRVRLKGFGIPFSSPDDSGRWGYEWPRSRLTGDDMRRLAVLGNYAKLPTNELLHLAVGVLYEHTRDLMLRLLDLHERTGRPFAELLDELAVKQSPSMPATPTPAAPAEAGPAVRHPHQHPDLPYTIHHGIVLAIEQLDGTPVLAAESPATGPRVQQFLPFDQNEEK